MIEVITCLRRDRNIRLSKSIHQLWGIARRDGETIHFYGRLASPFKVRTPEWLADPDGTKARIEAQMDKGYMPVDPSEYEALIPRISG